MIKLAASLVLWLVLSSPCRAQSLSPSAFAYGLTLTPEQPAAGSESKAKSIHAYTLPEDVLSRATESDLADLCVFDGAGRQLAHAVALPREHAAQKLELPIAHFPLEPRDLASGPVEISVERDAQGAIARAFSRRVLAGGGRLLSYLLELPSDRSPGSEPAPTLEALTLALEGAATYTTEVEVHASDDLRQFRFVTAATVARLEHEGRTLQRNVVALPETDARFLRLDFRSPPAELALRTVVATARERAAAPSLRWLKLTSRSVSDGDEQAYLYELKAALSPLSYRVSLPEGTVLIDATLLSGSRAEGPFQQLDRGLFRRDGESSRPLAGVVGRYFQLRVTAKGGGVRSGSPDLELGYVAPRVLFHGAGRGPYLLAYGSRSARCRKFEERELETLAAGALPSRDTVRAAAQKTLAGEAALRAPAAPRNWRVYLLWSALLAAVAALLMIARKLSKRL